MDLSRRAFLASFAIGLPLQTIDTNGQSPGGNTCKYSKRIFPVVEQPAIDGVRHEVWTASPANRQRRDVIVLHEITGASEAFFAYTDTLVEEGFTVHCPVLFGQAFVKSSSLRNGLLSVEACNPFSEFKCLKRSAYTPLNPWLVALAIDIAGPERRRLGAIGMCLTGIQPLAMLRCRSVVAPVLCQPTLPFGKDLRSRRDFGLPASDFDFAHARVHADLLKVLLIRYEGDTISSAERAQRLNDLFDPQIQYVKLSGSEHSSLVHHPDSGGMARASVIRFLKSIL